MARPDVSLNDRDHAARLLRPEQQAILTNARTDGFLVAGALSCAKETPDVDNVLQQAWEDDCIAAGRMDIRVCHIRTGWFTVLQFTVEQLSYVLEDLRQVFRECLGRDPRVDPEYDGLLWETGLLQSRTEAVDIAGRLAEVDRRERSPALEVVFQVMAS